MKDLTSEQIRKRLDEIERKQHQHEARDLDAELKEVMLKGGDLDQLENQQLDAERIARRLRVEYAALSTRLPEAEKEEALAKVEAMKKIMADQPKRIKAISKEIAPMVDAIVPLLREATSIMRKRVLDYKAVSRVVAQQRLPSSVLEEAGSIKCKDYSDALNALRTASSSTDGIDLSDFLAISQYNVGLDFDQNKVEV